MAAWEARGYSRVDQPAKAEKPAKKAAAKKAPAKKSSSTKK